PPQSTSLSSPFATPSVQVGATQIMFWQDLERQSFASLHFLPAPQAMHGPPQSVSVSRPFFTMSLQLGATQRIAALHTPEPQSMPAAQIFPSAQGAQLLPQSPSVSVPFFKLSVHDGGAQRPLWQLPLEHWVAWVHVLPSSHGAQLPPQ